MRTRSIVRSLGIGGVALIAVAVAVPLGSAASAAPPSADPTTAGGYAARWAAARVNASGFVPKPDASPNVSATLETALGLAAAHTDRATFDLIVAWLQANVESVIAPGGVDSPGAIGEVLMVAHVAGVSPASFGGVDLVARLSATLGDFAPGLYGAADPTYDGAFRQSLAMLGLAAVGAAVPAEARTWLLDQQCTSPAAASGGWQAYRADTAVACAAPDPVNFTGPDTNSTAGAVQALAATGGGGATAAGLDFLAGVESSTGGFAYIPGGEDDPNSTALVIQAIVAGGESPATGRWVKGSANPYTSLLAWQLGCTAAPADQGAFATPFSQGAPDDLATRQAVWGLFGAFPPGPGPFAPAPVPCQSTTTSTTAPASTSSTAPTTSSTVAVNPSPVAAVTAIPRFTG